MISRSEVEMVGSLNINSLKLLSSAELFLFISSVINEDLYFNGSRMCMSEEGQDMINQVFKTSLRDIEIARDLAKITKEYFQTYGNNITSYQQIVKKAEKKVYDYDVYSIDELDAVYKQSLNNSDKEIFDFDFMLHLKHCFLTFHFEFVDIAKGLAIGINRVLNSLKDENHIKIGKMQKQNNNAPVSLQKLLSAVSALQTNTDENFKRVVEVVEKFKIEIQDSIEKINNTAVPEDSSGFDILLDRGLINKYGTKYIAFAPLSKILNLWDEYEIFYNTQKIAQNIVQANRKPFSKKTILNNLNPKSRSTAPLE